MSSDRPLLRLEGVGKAYRPDSHAPLAVDGVSLQIRAGTITGIVGESGSGKPPGPADGGTVAADHGEIDSRA